MTPRFNSFPLNGLVKIDPCCPIINIEDSDTVTHVGNGTPQTPFIFTAIGGEGNINLTTNGDSGPATLVNNTLNIPEYSNSGGEVFTENTPSVIFSGTGTEDDPLSATATGGGTVLLPGAGTRSVIANPDGTLFTDINAYPTDLITGREYIFAFHKKFYNVEVPTVTLSGDSTTFGTGVTDSAYLLQNLLTKISNNVTASGINIFNDGVPSTNTQDWITSQLPGTLARNPDLMIIRWGINDAALGAATFETNLRAGLTTIRAQGDVTQIAIVLMAPNSTNDTPNGRDAAWYELINPIIRKAAKDFLCVYIDTFHYFHDSQNADDTLWMSNDFGDGRHIHPAEMENLWITSIIADVIFPTTFKQLQGSQFIHNNGSVVVFPATTTPTSTYPSGMSIYRATLSKGWPNDGMVVTFYNIDGVMLQINSSYTNTGLAFRTGLFGGDWSDFVSVGSPNTIPVNTLLSTPPDNSFENDGTNLYFTIGGVRKTVTLT